MFYMSIVIMCVIFNLHVLVNTFIQRTEQVPIELDISAIEKYVIIITEQYHTPYQTIPYIIPYQTIPYTIPGYIL